MDKLITHDGLALHWHHWPATQATRGVVLVVHGLGEHLGRYEELAHVLNAQGWHVAGCDLRGHGRSEGARGALAAPDAMLVDLAAMIDRARTLAAGRFVLLGHSMGGLIAGRFVAEALAEAPARWSRPVQALVMSSPALDPGMSRAQKLLLALLGPLLPHLALGNGLDSSWVSRSPQVVQAYQDDPLVHDRITPALVRFIVDAGARVREHAPRWNTRTLLMWAGADRCVAPRGSAAFAAAALAPPVSSQMFPALFHEIFNEPERETVLARLTGWLQALPPA